MKFILNTILVTVSFFCGTAIAQNSNTFEIVAPSAMPLKPPGGELEKLASINSTSLNINGVIYSRDNKKHIDFHRGLGLARASADSKVDENQRNSRSPSAVKDVTKIVLVFNPRKHASHHELQAASSAGTLTDKGWTGLERYITISNVGTYKLTEFDLAKTGGKFFLSNDAVNANVDNSPAATKTFVDDNGNIIEEVVWVSTGRFHMLTYSPDTQSSGIVNQRIKKDNSLSAISLAQALRN